MNVQGRIGHVKPEEAEEKRYFVVFGSCFRFSMKVGQILQVRLMGSVYIFQEDKCSVFFPLVS